jgi:hypothetical protein
MLKKVMSSVLTAGLLLALGQNAFGGDIERRQAKTIHDRLAGVPPSDPVLNAMETSLLSDPSGRGAAIIAMDDPAFYNITLKNFAAPWTNEEQSVFTPLNDYTSTVIGMIRDDIDFREVLYGDIIYTGNTATLGISPYSSNNNSHYAELEALGPVNGNLANPTVLVGNVPQSTVTGLPASATAGVITTRAAAKAFFYLGTNRAMFRFTLMNHLCTDLEPLKDNTRSPDKVRQDVSRSPGGDSRIYLNSCVGCHAGMDGLAGAYAYYELQFNGDRDTDVNTFENSAQIQYTNGIVTDKHLINENNFKPGHVTTDDSWVNYWRNGQNGVMWTDYPGVVKDSKGNAIGNGARSMGMELANSNSFAQCQVKKAFQAVCLRDPDDNALDRTEINSIVTTFKSNYSMKGVFRDVAAYCKGD